MKKLFMQAEQLKMHIHNCVIHRVSNSLIVKVHFELVFQTTELFRFIWSSIPTSKVEYLNHLSVTFS